MKKILVIDNYDSFVHNAVQLLRESSEPVNITIQLNDRIDFEKFGDYDGILLSPGPGIPEEAGDLMAAIGQIVRQRIPVLGICLGHQALARAFSLADLEEELDTVDKSTLFRTLTLFLAHHLVHGIDDGTGSLKYALCSSDCDCEIDDLHTHFYCTHCRRTFCLRGVAVPQVGLPDGFSAETINFVIKGICADCSGRN